MSFSALHYYGFIVEQSGGCPSLILGSWSPETGKSSTAQLALKMTSDSRYDFNRSLAIAGLVYSLSLSFSYT